MLAGFDHSGFGALRDRIDLRLPSAGIAGGMFLLFLSACSSFHARGYRYVDLPDFNSDSRLASLPLKGDGYAIVSGPHGERGVEFSTGLTGDDPTSAPLVMDWGSVCVEGIVNGKHRYPVILDTGNPDFFQINDIHVLENKLPVLADPAPEGAQVQTGTARIASLKIGGLSIENLLGTYYARHVERTYLGFGVASARHINLGLPILSSFKYVIFDQPAATITLSARRSLPDSAARGALSIPFQYVAIGPQMNRIGFTLPLDGLLCRLALDTGLVNGMVLRKEVWNQAHPDRRLGDAPPNSVFLAPYENTQSKGSKASYNLRVERMQLGRMVLKGVEAIVPAGDADVLTGFDGFLGMGAFADARLTIDFEHKRLLIAKPQPMAKGEGE